MKKLSSSWSFIIHVKMFLSVRAMSNGSKQTHP